jgi:hypothetical protein
LHYILALLRKVPYIVGPLFFMEFSTPRIANMQGI